MNPIGKKLLLPTLGSSLACGLSAIASAQTAAITPEFLRGIGATRMKDIILFQNDALFEDGDSSMKLKVNYGSRAESRTFAEQHGSMTRRAPGRRLCGRRSSNSLLDLPIATDRFLAEAGLGRLKPARAPGTPCALPAPVSHRSPVRAQRSSSRLPLVPFS